MRFLECIEDGKLRLTRNYVVDIPRYAILSHTWGSDADEVTFQDLMDGTGTDKAGYKKLKFCSEQATRDGLRYFWVDSCCIDQSNSNEVSEAINSMFRWYGDAARCYVYLSDIPASDLSNQLSEASWEADFRASRWFKRGWTLQELLAPPSVEFFTREGQRLGDKQSLVQEIHEITGIPVPALQGTPLTQFRVEERFEWSANRQTTRGEDLAYCLLGIFGVFMSPIYGEGKKHALRRLRREIGLPAENISFSPWFLVPYPENPAFVGRVSILEKLQKQRFNSTSQSRIAIFGLGGIGKTQIALAYVYWLREAQPDVSIFWIHASSVERFRQAFASIAQECQIAGYDDPKADTLLLVKSWLEKKEHGRWLMIIDNADDTQLFFGPPPADTRSAENAGQGARLGYYVPECAHGSILVTTRNKQAGLRLTKGVSPIEVTKMDDKESVQLLQARLEEYNNDGSDLSMLSVQLDHLPLALVQAAAFIQENSITVSEYLQLLSGTDSGIIDLLSEEFETVGRDSETPRAVTQAWIISFEQIQQQNTVAGELLSLMAFFDRQAIATEFLTCYGEEQQADGYSKLQLQKALGILKAFCFITVTKDQSLNIHRLVQLVTQKWLANKGMWQQFAEQALVVISKQYPIGEYENWEICSRYLPHVYAVLKCGDMISQDGKIARGYLLHNAAWYLLNRGLWKEAEGLQEESVAQHRTALGPEHLWTLTSMANLASTYRTQGRWEEAEKLEVLVLETRKTKLGADHPETLTSMNNLASTYMNQGRWEEAEKLQVMVLETRKTKLGAGHPYTLTSMANLASTYRNQGRWKEAEKLQAEELKICSRVMGADHPNTLTSMANLASTYMNQGRWKEAEKLQAEELKICSRVMGADHPSTLTSMANLASAYSYQGRWEAAEKLQVLVLETRKTKLGADHPSTLTSMNNLAFTWKGIGRHQDALRLIQTCFKSRQRNIGPNHPDTQSTLHAMLAWQRDTRSVSQEGSLESVEDSGL